MKIRRILSIVFILIGCICILNRSNWADHVMDILAVLNFGLAALIFWKKKPSPVSIVDPIVLLYKDADQLHTAGKYHEEVELLNNAFSLAGEQAEYWRKLGRAHESSHNSEAAQNCYEYAKSLNSNT